MAKKIDMTGWVMKEHGVPDSRLTIIEEDKNYKKEHNLKSSNNFAYWKCICECGNICTKLGTTLRNGSVKSCGCLAKENKQFKGEDLTGKKFNKLKVIKLTDKTATKQNRRLWQCKCDCGNIIYTTSTNLVSNQVTSCGCVQKERASLNSRKEIEGQKFGQLTAIKYLRTNERHDRVYLCKCDCGNYHEATVANLIGGHITSCGCINSKGEAKIKQLLNNNKIFFIAQKTFNDCKFLDTGYLAYFDFYINNNFLLEFDGQQHFFSRKSGWDTEKKFLKTKERDEFKNSYCFSHNIPLKRIPYWALSTLTIEDIMGDKYLVHPPNN